MGCHTTCSTFIHNWFLAVINGVTWGPYKWPKINGQLGLFHPEISGVFWDPTYNWETLGPCIRMHENHGCFGIPLLGSSQLVSG